jgi:single-stranded DNA-binding protein
MNFSSFCAQLTEDPREVFTSATSTAVRCNAVLPPVGNKAPAPIEINAYGKSAQRFIQLKKDAQIYLHGGRLRHDLESRTYSVHGGVIAVVNDQFPILNTVILSGRCIKDIEQGPKGFNTTESGLMICNQTLSVVTGKGQADLFNFYAMNKAEDKLNHAELLSNFTRKGVGLTLQGRLVADAWNDKKTNERRLNLKIMLVSMTLAPRANNGAIQPQNTVPEGAPVKGLWGGKTADDIAEPWGVNTGTMPDLPDRFANSDNEEEPF